MELIFISSMISIFFVSIIFIIIGKIERAHKLRDLFSEKYWGHAILAGFIYAVLGVIIVSIPYTFAILFSIGIRVLIGYIISSEAFKNNRNKKLWFVLGFLEPFSATVALIASGKTFKISFSNEVVVEQINIETKIKLKKIKALRSSSILTKKEFERKILQIRWQYYNEIKSIEQNTEKTIDIHQLKKIEQAYKDGFLTEDEYQQKINP